MTGCLDVDSAMLEEFQEMVVDNVYEVEEAVFAGLALHVLEIVLVVATLVLLALWKKAKSAKRQVRTCQSAPLPNRRNTVYKIFIDEIRV